MRRTETFIGAGLVTRPKAEDLFFFDGESRCPGSMFSESTSSKISGVGSYARFLLLEERGEALVTLQRGDLVFAGVFERSPVVISALLQGIHRPEPRK